MKTLVLVDGNALIHRAYHATPPLTTSKGELINAVYGFTLLILKAIEDLTPNYLAVAWDLKGPTFRHNAYENYKSNRGPADEALSNQYDRVHEVIKALSIPEFKLPGFEADDLIGALAVQAVKKERNLEVIILTGDRDIMQLINARVKVLMPKKTIQDVGLYGMEEFIARFGFNPENLIDYKALAGDASDNIPGVTGIGDITATKLIQQYSTLEDTYKHLRDLPESLRKKLEEGRESAIKSKQLATIETEIPIKLDLQDCQTHEFDRNKVTQLFEELEFKSLLSRIPGLEGKQSNSQTAAQGSKSVNSSSSAVVTRLDRRVEKILQTMTKVGVLTDIKFLEKFGTDLKAQLSKIEKDIYSTVGYQFNLNSPKQLSEVLFDELKLPVIKKTKTGRSTDEGTLVELVNTHPIVPLLLKYRTLFKLISTYIDSLPKYVGSDGRIHSTFNVEGAATGRLSSQDPNLQNIPIRGTAGSEIRKAFIAPKGKILLGVDYSQIDLRIMAHLSSDPGLTRAFNAGLDVHLLTASKIFKTPIEKVTKEQRGVGKTMNFATLYGQGPHALSKALGVDYAVAREYIAEYFAQFPKVKDWMQKTLVKAYRDGYVETVWGRKRFIPELQAASRILKSYGERAAVNHPIQGTSADMIKKAMVEINKRFAANDKRQAGGSGVPNSKSCQLILQIHDELLFECDPDCLYQAAGIIKQEMERSITLSVPVVAEVKSGPNWGEMEPLPL